MDRASPAGFPCEEARLNYIGSKQTLLPFIQQVYESVAEGDERIACDLFAGTGAVGRLFKGMGLGVIANDLQYYAYALNRAYIGLHSSPAFHQLRMAHGSAPLPDDGCVNAAKDALALVNGLPPREGFLARGYSPAGGRQFFTVENAEKGDAIRTALAEWRGAGVIDEDEFFYLLSSLLEAMDQVANTASVYGAYLKKFKATARKSVALSPLRLTNGGVECAIHQRDANDLIEEIECDILYIDPPYNQRQYGANYHVLETIARYDEPELRGATGLRPYDRSRYCGKNSVKEAFSHLIAAAPTRHILVSYNDEGLLTLDEITRILSLRGEPRTFTKSYSRYRADSEREYKRSSTVEYLHYVRVVR